MSVCVCDHECVYVIMSVCVCDHECVYVIMSVCVCDHECVYVIMSVCVCDHECVYVIIENLQKSLTLVQDWMFTNKLKLNPDKTEFMLIGNKCHRNKFNSKFPVDILNNSIPPATHAKNLGVIIDSDLNFQRHIKNTVKVCNYFIRDIRRV